MVLMSNVGQYQTKECPGRIKWEHYTTIRPEKNNSSIEEVISSLPEGEWAVAESQQGMKQGECI